MKILIIGFGTMGRAIAKALAAKKAFKVSVFDRDLTTAKRQGKPNKIKIINSLTATDRYDFVLVAVKPQDLEELANDNKSFWSKQGIIISIAAGVTLKKLTRMFEEHPKIIRMMPNLALSVGQGVAAWKSSWRLSRPELKRVSELFSAFTSHFSVNQEKALDAVTAVSGSGPAYFFHLASAMEKAARKLGFNATEARDLVEKTFLGAALLQVEHRYDELIKQVASKRGTTEAALKVFADNNTEKIISAAMTAAFKRAQQLSK